MFGQLPEHKDMKNLIIVGYGYMGRRVANQLAKEEELNIYCLSRHPQSSPTEISNLYPISFDLDSQQHTDFPLSHQIVQDSKILYLAPPPVKGQSDPRFAQFLENLNNLSAIPQKIVLISTTGVYGDCHGDWVDELRTLNPQVDRAFRRVDAERHLTHFCHQHHIDYTILRVAGIYAEDKLPTQRLKQQKPLLNQEDSPFSNRIHADDLSNICLQALHQEGSGVYNCADGHPSTMYEYFSGIAAALALPQPPTISRAEAEQQLSPGMLSYMNESRRIDNRKLLQELQVQLKYPSFDDFLHKLKSNKE